MLISIQATYRGYVLNRVLEPGEHEVPDSVGEHLIENMGGVPWYARRVDTPPLETKPAIPLETKPMMPEEVKAAPALKPRRPVPRPKVKP
jgi:hypothetical protein